MTPTSISPLPEEVTTERLTLRLWRLEDAVQLSEAVAESLDHLRPWMSWAAAEPLSAEDRRELIGTFQRDWESGAAIVYGAFRSQTDGSDTVIGGCGFSRREGIGLEIGYWVHVDHLHQGYASEMAAGLADAAFTVAGIERVEIHHDRANTRSGAVPARLGFTFVGEQPDEAQAPAEDGIDCGWVVFRADWLNRPERRR